VSETVPLPIDLARPTEEVAKDLLGCVLVHIKGGRVTSGRIVETEAYGGPQDSASSDSCSHAYRGCTKRNQAMFGPPGRLYVYFIYGMHYCGNIVAHAPGQVGAVLLRALEPVDGVDLMRRRRRNADSRLLCTGPARLVQALGLRRADDRRRIGTGRLFLLSDTPPAEIVAVPRVGVRGPDSHRLWRFCDSVSDCLSVPARF